MGQDNQKVQFQGHVNQNVNQRTRIFKRHHSNHNSEICQIPGCNCPLQHQQVHAKVCQSCLDAPPPFLKTKTKPKYYQQNYTLKSPAESPYIEKHYTEPDFAQALPRRIPYYNAWSLPTQRYQIKDKSPYNHDDRSSIYNGMESRYQPSHSQNTDNLLFQQLINKSPQKLQQMQVPKEYGGRRKQNLNLID